MAPELQMRQSPWERQSPYWRFCHCTETDANAEIGVPRKCNASAMQRVTVQYTAARPPPNLLFRPVGITYAAWQQVRASRGTQNLMFASLTSTKTQDDKTLR